MANLLSNLVDILDEEIQKWKYGHENKKYETRGIKYNIASVLNTQWFNTIQMFMLQ